MSTDTVLRIGIQARDDGAKAAFAAVNAELARTDERIAAVNARMANLSGLNGASSLVAVDDAFKSASVSADGFSASVGKTDETVARASARLKTEWSSAVAQGAREYQAFGAVTAETQARIDAASASIANWGEATTVASGKAVRFGGDVKNTASTLKGDFQAALAQGALESQRLGSVTDGTASKIRASKTAMDDYAKSIKAASAEAGLASINWAKVTRDVTLLGAAVLAGSLDVAVKFQSEMQRVQGNTGATVAQMKVFQQEVLDLGAKGPAALDDIASAFRHVSDLGYRNADAMTVTTEAWKGAIATGGKVEDVANALATILGNQHAPATQAAHDIDVIVTSAQQGNLTLPDFANNFSKIGTIAGSVHQPLEQVSAAFATVSRATADPALAQTYMQGMLQHVIAPTGPAIKIMKELAQTTGVDLRGAFQQFANGTITLHDLLVKVKDATGGASDKIFQLLGGIRGGQAGLILLNNHWEDYNKILGLTETANNHVNTSFEEMQQTAGAQLGTLKNQVQELGISLGTDLLPSITGIAKDIGPLVIGLHNLNQETGGGVSEALKLGVEWGGAMLALRKLTPMVLAAKDAFYGLAAGELAAEAANPVGLIVAALVLSIAEIKALNDQIDQSHQKNIDLVKQYAEGKITLVQFAEATHGVGTAVAEAARAEYDHAKAARETNDVLVGTGRILDTLIPKYKNLAGAGSVKLAPNLSPPSSAAAAGFDLSAEVSAAQQKMDAAANQVAYDTNVLHITVQKHIDELNRDRQKYIDLETEQSKLTNTTKDLHAALLQQDQYTKDSTAAGNRLLAIQHQVADEEAKGIPVTRAQWQELGKATAGSKRYTDTLAALDGKTVHVASSLELLDKAVLKGTATEALYQRAAESQIKLKDKNEILAGIVDNLNRRTGDYASTLADARTKLQSQLDSAEGKLYYDATHGASAALLASDEEKMKSAGKALDEFDAGLYSGQIKAERLADAAEKAAKKLLDIAAIKLAKPGAEGAESATRAGEFAQIGKPSGSGGADPISLIEQRINNLNPHDYSSEGAYEKAVQGLFNTLDSAITAYGTKTQRAFDKAAADWEKNPANVGSDAWNKKQEAAYQKLLNSPEVKAGIANISREGGFAQRGSFGGTAAASRAAATDFQDQVNLGILAKANADRQNAINLKVAESTGDVAAQFQILSQQMEGPYTQAFAQIEKDYLTHSGDVTADSDALRASTTAKYDEAVGQREATRITTEGLRDAALAASDFAEYWKNATSLDNQNLSDSQDRISGAYRSGGAPTQADIEAYQRNKAAVDQDTQSVLMMDHATGQYAAELQGRMAQATQRSSDAEALLTEKIHDRIPVSVEEVQAARDAVQADKDWTDAQRQETEMIGTIPEKWDAMLQDMSTGLDNAVKTLASDLLGGMTDSNFGAQLQADAQAGAAFQQQTMAMSEAESEAKIRILEAAGAFGDAQSQELEAAKAKADADYANASAAGASADQLQSLYQAASDASYALTAWQNTLSSPDQQGSQDANQQSFDENGFETSYGYQQDQQAQQDYQSQLDSQLQSEMQAQQQAVTQGIADGFAATQAQQDRKKLDLEHEKALINLNTSLDPTTKAYQVQQITLQEDGLAIQTDQLKYQQLAATGGTVAELLQAQNQMIADTYKLQEDQLAGIQQIAGNTGSSVTALQSEVKTLQALLTQKNSPAGQARPIRNPGSNVTLSQLMGPQASDFQANVTP